MKNTHSTTGDGDNRIQYKFFFFILFYCMEKRKRNHTRKTKEKSKKEYNKKNTHTSTRTPNATQQNRKNSKEIPEYKIYIKKKSQVVVFSILQRFLFFSFSALKMCFFPSSSACVYCGDDTFSSFSFFKYTFYLPIDILPYIFITFWQHYKYV